MIPEQEFTEAPATTVEPTTDLTAEFSVPLGLDIDTDLAQLPGNVIAIASVRYKLAFSLSSQRRIYIKRQQRNRDRERVRWLKRRSGKCRKTKKLAAKEVQHR